LKAVYETLLFRSLERRGLRVERQKDVTFVYDGVPFVNAFRVDLLVEGAVVVEIKSMEKVAAVNKQQLLTYLRLLRLEVGLLLNFGAPTMKEGTVRVVNEHIPSQQSPLTVNRRAARTPKSAP
jgi:iron complex transport system substrate-binding protein